MTFTLKTYDCEFLDEFSDLIENYQLDIVTEISVQGIGSFAKSNFNCFTCTGI